MKWNYWGIVGLAVWLLVSPWILGYAELNLIVWNNVIVAVLTAILILWNVVKNN